MNTLSYRSFLAQPWLLSGFTLIGAMTLWVMLQVEIPMLLGMRPDWNLKVAPYSSLLHVHAAASMLALLIGPAQFFPALRRGYPRWHRRVGYLYTMAIAVAAPIAIWISIRHLPAGENLSNVVAGLLWLLFTGATVVAAVQGRTDTHQRWAYRSYALTATFVVSRVQYEIAGWHVPESFGGYTSALWIYTILALVIADSLPLQTTKASAPVTAEGAPSNEASRNAREREVRIFLPNWSLLAAGVLFSVATIGPSAMLLFATNLFGSNDMPSVANGTSEVALIRGLLSDSRPSDQGDSLLRVPFAHDPLWDTPFLFVNDGNASVNAVDSRATDRTDTCADQAEGTVTGLSAQRLDDTPTADIPTSELQRRLKTRGYDPGPIDGQWGPRTRRALERLQREAGLAISGRIDAATAAVLGLENRVSVR